MKRRRRQRGVSTVSAVLECSMVMGWFVVLVLGEKAVSNAADARRAAETAAEQSATSSSADHCRPESVSVGQARTSASVIPNGRPHVSHAVALVQALGLGRERTFPYYVNTLDDVLVHGRSTATEVHGDVDPGRRLFDATRDRACLEKPIDVPRGSMNQYRQRIWELNLKGY